MKKILASIVLLFVMLVNSNATEAAMTKSDSNCTSPKCKVEKSKDSNCTKEKCKMEKKSDCATPCEIKDCTKCDKKSANKTTGTWSATSTMKSSSCCKNKKKEEAKEEKPTMKCAAGKCGAGKCGGK
jgi:hypothetical protein